MIKAAFFDIDGTLVSFNTHKISDSSKEAIRLLKEKEIKVFIATGRIKKHINNIDDLVFDGYITANGFDCYIGDKSIYKHTIAKEEIYSLMDYLKKSNISSQFFSSRFSISFDCFFDFIFKLFTISKEN